MRHSTDWHGGAAGVWQMTPSFTGTAISEDEGVRASTDAEGELWMGSRLGRASTFSDLTFRGAPGLDHFFRKRKSQMAKVCPKIYPTRSAMGFDE